jgi:hypothetical protein
MNSGDFTINQRVRFISLNPKYEPIGTITEVLPDGVVITWDDDHPPNIVQTNRLAQLEVL